MAARPAWQAAKKLAKGRCQTLWKHAIASGIILVGRYIGVAMSVKGLDNVLHNLQELDTRIIRRATTSAIRAGAGVIRDAARVNARALDDPGTPAQIYRNIVARSIRRRDVVRQGGDAGARVGVLGGARDLSKQGEIKGAGSGNPGGDTFYWRFLEFGTQHMAARPILRPAAEENKTQAFNATAEQLRKRVDIELSRLKTS